MRLFVCLRPSRQAVAHLEAALAGRGTSRVDQWHVTLAFLGEVEDPAVLYDGLRTAAAATPPLELQLAGGGAFRGASVVWAGIGGNTDGLAALAAAVQSACRDAGIVLEQRRFRPHLTVGKPSRVDPDVLIGYSGPTWQAHEVELVHSVLGRKVNHTVLERFPMSGG